MNAQLKLLLYLPWAAAICVNQCLILETVCDGGTVICVELLEVEAVWQLQVNDLLLHRPDLMLLAFQIRAIPCVQRTNDADDCRVLARARDVGLILLVNTSLL